MSMEFKVHTPKCVIGQSRLAKRNIYREIDRFIVIGIIIAIAAF